MRILTFLTIALLTACSSTSQTMQSNRYDDLQLKQVTPSVASYKGETVRWGGKIIKVHNFDTHSQLQLVQFPLNRYGRPIQANNSQGRFFTRSNDFLDPEIFKEGMMLTVVGQISDQASITVDKKNLVVPVVEIQESQRWPANSASGREYNPKHDWPFIGYGYYGTGSYSP